MDMEKMKQGLLMNRLAMARAQVPALRLGQLIENALMLRQPTLYNITDEELVEAVEQAVKKYSLINYKP